MAKKQKKIKEPKVTIVTFEKHIRTLDNRIRALERNLQLLLAWQHLRVDIDGGQNYVLRKMD